MKLRRFHQTREELLEFMRHQYKKLNEFLSLPTHILLDSSEPIHYPLRFKHKLSLEGLEEQAYEKPTDLSIKQWPEDPKYEAPIVNIRVQYNKDSSGYYNAWYPSLSAATGHDDSYGFDPDLVGRVDIYISKRGGRDFTQGLEFFGHDGNSMRKIGNFDDYKDKRTLKLYRGERLVGYQSPYVGDGS